MSFPKMLTPAEKRDLDVFARCGHEAPDGSQCLGRAVAVTRVSDYEWRTTCLDHADGDLVPVNELLTEVIGRDRSRRTNQS